MDSFQLVLLFLFVRFLSVLVLFAIAVFFLLFVVFKVCLSLLFSSSPHLSLSFLRSPPYRLAQNERSFFFLDVEMRYVFPLYLVFSLLSDLSIP